MTEMNRSGFSELDRLTELVRRTHEALAAVAEARDLPDGAADFLETRTLPHVEQVQSGFQGWLRSDSAGMAELRWLVNRAGPARVAAPATPAERDAAAAETSAERAAAVRTGRDGPGLRRVEPWTLAALAHARLVLATIPTLPEPLVRFPSGRRTYADIPIPRGPAELADRIDELETLLWAIVTGRAPAPTSPALRRTYGFFDAADRLGLRGFRGAA